MALKEAMQYAWDNVKPWPMHKARWSEPIEYGKPLISLKGDIAGRSQIVKDQAAFRRRVRALWGYNGNASK